MFAISVVLRPGCRLESYITLSVPSTNRLADAKRKSGQPAATMRRSTGVDSVSLSSSRRMSYRFIAEQSLPYTGIHSSNKRYNSAPIVSLQSSHWFSDLYHRKPVFAMNQLEEVKGPQPLVTNVLGQKNVVLMVVGGVWI